MQRIGLLTFQKIYNYGAVLQGYALQQSIIGAGYSCEVIDLLFSVHKEYVQVKRALPLLDDQQLGKTVQHSLSIRIRLYIRKVLTAILLNKQKNKFSEFCDKNMVFSQRRYYNFDELFSSPPDYDAYVTGSDQVWNPTYSHSPEPYFLTFVDKSKPRIAYAPSFGVSEIPQQIWPRYREWLRGITHLSVREVQGAQIIGEISSLSAQVVLDPTLLLDEKKWEKVAVSSAQAPYIFCYALGDQPVMMKLCYHLSELTGLPIIKIGDIKDVFDKKVKVVLDAGPSEFLGLIKDASIVVTNSFHGTCFSITYRKPFYTVPTVNLSVKSRNSRLTSLLEILALDNRLFNEETTLPSLDHIEIDYSIVEPLLIKQRNSSLKFLTEALFSSQPKENK